MPRIATMCASRRAPNLSRWVFIYSPSEVLETPDCWKFFIFCDEFVEGVGVNKSRAGVLVFAIVALRQSQ